MSDLMEAETSHNSSFSRSIPGLQLAWDSTSLGALKECPRKYYYNLVVGWTSRTQNVHLVFGTAYHSALEAYDHAKAAGAAHEEALRAAIRKALSSTWFNGGPWISDDPNKNRATLVRSVVWYLDQFEEDSLSTVLLSNGKPAVELSYRYETDYIAADGSKYLLCGHLDKIVDFDNRLHILDHKTTKSTVDSNFFTKYSPDNQFMGYVLGAGVVYGIPVRGLIVDVAQVAVTFSRFYRGLITYTESQLEEYYYGVGYWLRQAEEFAQTSFWPMNEKSCSNYGGCPYRQICSKPPSLREEWLKASFVRRTWDPLQVRGDI